MDREKLVKDLLYQIRLGEDSGYVEKNQRVAARKLLGREDVPQYSLTAIFEALVNAVAHRDYDIYGAHIRLHMFADRLVLCSPAAPTNTQPSTAPA
jgi:predicted HTH transcriptional regulator